MGGSAEEVLPAEGEGELLGGGVVREGFEVCHELRQPGLRGGEEGVFIDRGGGGSGGDVELVEEGRLRDARGAGGGVSQGEEAHEEPGNEGGTHDCVRKMWFEEDV